MMPQINVEEAYREAVTALGEAQVRERILTKFIDDLQREITRLSTPKTPQAKGHDKDTSVNS